MTSSSVPAMRHVDWLQRYAMTRPKHRALSDPDLTLTYGELYRAIHLFAHRLSEAGVKRGQTVGVCMNGQALFAVTFAALNMMGCVPITVARPRGADVGLDLPAHFAVDAVLVEPPYDRVAPAGAITVDTTWVSGARERFHEWTEPGFANADETAQIFSSSGTTGAPKFMRFSSRQMEARFIRRNFGAFVPLIGGRSVCRTGLRAYGGFSTVFSILWAGGTAYLGWSSQDIPALIEREHITRLDAAPAQQQSVLEHLRGRRFDTSSLKGLICGGSNLPAKLLEALRRNLCPVVVDLYGSTEVGALAMGYAKEGGEIGHLYPWIHAQAVDENHKPLPAGAEGMLRFRTEDMITEYLNDAQTTAQYFRDGWFYPGDMGSIDGQRLLRVSGRKSERINAGGVKVAPEPIEDVVLSFDGVTDCAVFGAPDAMGVDKVWAAVVVRHGTDLTALSKYCHARLGGKAPHNYLKLADIPRNPNGKILRRNLLDLAQASSRR